MVKKRMLASLVILPMLTACGTQQPHISIPTASGIKRVTVGGGLPGSPFAVLTRRQDATVLTMLKKAKDIGYHTPRTGGYPPSLTIQMTDGGSITVTPSINVRKNGHSETGVPAKNYVDWYDSTDQSTKGQRLYSPDLYTFLNDWKQKIPRSQWQ